MAEYIEREAFLKDIEDRYCLPCKEAGKDHNGCMCRACWVDDMRGDVIDATATDVAPVVHGTWEYIPQMFNTLSQFRCPFCGWWSLDPSIDGAYNYCPGCGARMDGDDDALD